MSERKVIHVWVDPDCMSESRPCQHFTQLQYDNGEQEDRIDNSTQITKYIDDDTITVTGCDITHFKPPPPKSCYRYRIETECLIATEGQCKHKVTVTHDDGTTTEELMTAAEIDNLLCTRSMGEVYITRTAMRHFGPRSLRF